MHRILRMLALPDYEIGQTFGTPLGFTLCVQIFPIDPYFSFDILKIYILKKHLPKYFRILITHFLFYLALKRVILRMYFLLIV